MDLELQLAEAREELSRQEARVEQVQAQRDAKAQELNEKDREVESLKVDVAGLEATLRGQRRELADQGGRLGSLTRECENHADQAHPGGGAHPGTGAGPVGEDAGARRTGLRAHRAAARRPRSRSSAVAERTQLLEDREKDILQLRNTRDQLEIHCEELERDLAAMVSQHEKQQLELMKGVEERDAQIGHLNASVGNLQEQTAALGREKQALEGNLNERSARLEALTGAINDLENSIRRASDLTRPF